MQSASATGARWRKSSRSANGANCVELACSPVPAIRDSKAPNEPALRADWTGLVRAARAGAFDGRLS